MRVPTTQNTHLIQIMALAIVIRVAVFIYLAFYPMPNETGLPISPMLMQQGGDMNFYLLSQQLYGNNPGRILDVLLNIFVAPIASWKQLFIVSGPIQPALLALFDYGPGNTLPLGLFYLVLASVLVCLWLRWLASQGMPTIWLLVFALLPNPVWFMIYISTDLPFAVLVGCFYIVYFSSRFRGYQRRGVLITLLIATALSRPNAISLLLFVLADQVLGHKSMSTRLRWQISIVGAILLAALSFFYLPYLFSFVEASQRYTFFGITQRDYLLGAFDSLPAIINIPISWAALLAAKALYFVGLRPSYGDTGLLLVLLRSAAGLVLLPGLLYMFIKGQRSTQLFLALYLLPIFLGASQDRYNLAIQPILFYYGTLAIAAVWSAIAGSRSPALAGPSPIPTAAERKTSEPNGGT